MSGLRHVVVHKFDVADPFELPDVIWEGREQVMKSSGRNGSKIGDDPEYIIVPFTPTEAPPKMMSPGHGIFSFLARVAGSVESRGFP